MVNMFAKYDNLDPNYIPVNTYWPKAPVCEPAAILLTRKLVSGDTWKVKFKINNLIVDKFKDTSIQLTIYNFRGEEICTISSSLAEITEFSLADNLQPDVYYLKLTMTGGNYTYTIYDRKGVCLTVI